MNANFHVFFVICTCFLAVGADRLPLYLDSDTSNKGSTDLPFRARCERDCSSAPRQNYCGNNGRTYDSYCRVLQAKCGDPYLNVTAGRCRNNARCRKERSHILKVRNLPNYTQTINVPSCSRDGSYAPTQCSVYLGYCWCVTRLGELRRNTTFQIGGSAQSCEGRGRSKKKCPTEADKAAFALKIRGMITSDVPKRFRHISQSPDKQRDTINRKHSDMDRNHDGSLDFREMRRLLKKYRKKVPRSTRSCAKVFAKYCDLDQNKHVSAAEWSFCLGFQQNPGRNDRNPRGTDSYGSVNDSRPQIINERRTSNITWNPDQPQGTSPSSSIRTCREERTELLKGIKKNVNIPECDGPNNEFYKKIQCLGSFCYCVFRDTGVPVPSTSVHRSEGVPDCENVESPGVPSPIPGCPDSLKQRFLDDVQRLLNAHMFDKKRDGVRDWPEEMPVKEQAAQSFFDNADKDGNGVLSRNERGLKKLLNSDKKLSRKCSKKFPQHCDRNKDGETTLNEFIGCLELRHQALRRMSTMKGLINKLQTTDDPDNL